MTAAKFKLIVFPVSGFALSNIANIFVRSYLEEIVAAPV
jgi:hypothetical protein